MDLGHATPNSRIPNSIEHHCLQAESRGFIAICVLYLGTIYAVHGPESPHMEERSFRLPLYMLIPCRRSSGLGIVSGRTFSDCEVGQSGTESHTLLLADQDGHVQGTGG